MKKIDIQNITIYHGDSVEILPKLGECADLVLTDPPYRLTSGGKDTGEMGGCLSPEQYSNSGSIVECDIDWPDFMPLLYDSMRGDSHCYTMCNNRNVHGMLNAAENAKFGFHNLLVWDKGTATPNRWYMKNLEFVGFFYKGKAKYINDMGSKQLIYVAQEDYGDHPTTKPTALMENYIRQSTQEGQTVLDPFCGVGSTLLAAAKSGRKAIGIELDEEWFNLAIKRIENYYSKPKQTAMF